MAFMQYLNRIQFDHGARRLLPAELEGLGVTRPMIVSDEGLVAAGVLDTALDSLDAAGLPRFTAVSPNPDEKSVLAALALYRDTGCDGLVAVGGGSPIDCAKAVALLATHPGRLADHLARTGGSDRIGPIAPIIAVPTTAGTGSEVGRGAGITLADGEKGVFLSPHLVPAVAICDPELTLGLPPWLTAGTGVDALAHGLEAFLSPAVNPPADAIALDAIARLAEHLPRAVANGADRDTRWQVMMGAVSAAMTTWKGLGPAHALSVAFDDLGLHHGTVVGVLLPHTTEFVLPVVPRDRRDRLAAALRCPAQGIPERLAELTAAIGLPPGLAAMGVAAEHLDQAAHAAVGTPFNRTSPRPGTADDYRELARAALGPDATTPNGPERIAVRSPRTGKVDHWIVPPTPAEISATAGRLRDAQVGWRDLGLDGRIAALRRWADAVEAHADEIGDAEERDTGRRRLSHEVPTMVAHAVRTWCAKAPDVVRRAGLSGTSSVSPDVSYSTQLEPYPLLGVISPWNHPFLLSTLDAVPALLAGTAVLVKPSEIAPRFVEPVMRSIAEVPELASVLHYVTGAAETGRLLIDAVDVVCFTGSVPTGRRIAVACAERFIPAFLELGGKDAAIVTASVDVDRAADAVLRGAVQNTGQLCFSTERVYVDERAHDTFVAAITDKARALRPTYPSIDDGHIGPFVTERQGDVVDDHLADALAKGATLECGGFSERHGGGRYMPATVLTGVHHGMKIMSEETFGPIVPIMPFADVDEAVALANDSAYGLSAAVLAGDADEAERIARRIDAGAISLQDTSLTIMIMSDVEKTSFGHSGLGGSRMGPNALLRFLRRKALIRRDGPITTMAELAEGGPHR